MGKVVRTITEDGGILCCALDSTDMAAAAEQIHTTSAVVTAALGRLMTACSMMGTMMKSTKDSVTIRLVGNGPMGSAIAVADGIGNVRGYVQNPVVELPLNPQGKLDVAGAVGKEGMLYVIKDMGMKEPYVGQTPIVSGEIAEDITYYYATSEQTPTACGLGVLVNPDLTVQSAGGYLVQLMPGVEEEAISRLEENLKNLPPISAMLADGKTPEEIAFKVLEGFNPNLLDEYDVEYRCDCSRERVERALISLGSKELEEMATSDEPCEVGCQFCSNKYHFSKEDLLTLAKSR